MNTVSRSAGPAVVVHTEPKQGNAESENEDGWAVNADHGRFAVADGASTSARSDMWSKILVEAFAEQHLDPLEPGVLRRLRKRWWELVWRADLPWFAQDKLLRGAAATFVGLSLSAGAYRARAVGDSCLFHLREDEVLLAGPLTDPDEFDRFPETVRTTADPLADGIIWDAAGTYRAGDVFVLATDATAVSLLQDFAGPRCVRLQDSSSFAGLVARGRADGRNDDMTMCVIAT